MRVARVITLALFVCLIAFVSTKRLSESESDFGFALGGLAKGLGGKLLSKGKKMIGDKLKGTKLGKGIEKVKGIVGKVKGLKGKLGDKVKGVAGKFAGKFGDKVKGAISKKFKGFGKGNKQKKQAPVETESDISNGATVTATTSLNVRNAPCTNGGIVRTVNQGTSMKYTGQSKTACGHTWYSVSGNGFNGWAASGYLSQGGSAPAPANPPSVGGADVSSYPTSYTTSGYTYSGRKAQVLHFLKAKLTASATTYSSHSEGPLGSADLWTSGAVYAKDNRQMAGMNALADYISKNLRPLGLSYVIWKQRILGTWSNGVWKNMEDRGGITANHFDHVHITFAK